MPCERCIKMDLECVYKHTEKPVIPKLAVSSAKRNKVIENTQHIQRQVLGMEQQLRALKVIIQLEAEKEKGTCEEVQGACYCLDPSDCPHLQPRVPSTAPVDWQVSLHRGKNGIVFETSIKTMADVATLFTESLRYFSIPSLPNGPKFPAEHKIRVTHKMLQIEQLFRVMFRQKTPEPAYRPMVPIVHSDWIRSAAKLHLIDAYFSCAGMINPVFVKAYYRPYLARNPHGMLASAMAGFAGYSQCRHVHLEGFAYPRQELAESFRKEGREALEEVLFDSEPEIETAATLMLIGQCALIMLRNQEARTCIGMAWRMAADLKPRYFPLIGHPDNNLSARAETWRRLFYTVRFLEQNMLMLYDGINDISCLAIHTTIGYPTLLPCEENDPEVVNAVNVYHHTARMGDCHISTQLDAVGYKLFAGYLDSVSFHAVQRLESTLFSFWYSLPPHFHLSEQPMEYLQLDRIQQCPDNYILYLNQLYYMYWMTFQAKLMKAPSSDDLKGASLGNMDSRRALVIVSICCDAVAKIFQVLYCRLPCMVELHWLLVAGDAMGLLKDAANRSIRTRAQLNLQTTLRILGSRMQIVRKNTRVNIPIQDVPSSTGRIPLTSFNNQNSRNHVGQSDNLDSASMEFCHSTGSVAGSSSLDGLSTSSSISSLAEYDEQDQFPEIDTPGIVRQPSPYFGEVNKTLELHYASFGYPGARDAPHHNLH
ncbi:Zn(2)-C6 fungal-specific transcription factor [Phycomyces blakesleeanus]